MNSLRIPIVWRLTPTVVGVWRGYMPEGPYKNADFAQTLDWEKSTAGFLLWWVVRGYRPGRSSERSHLAHRSTICSQIFVIPHLSGDLTKSHRESCNSSFPSHLTVTVSNGTKQNLNTISLCFRGSRTLVLGEKKEKMTMDQPRSS